MPKEVSLKMLSSFIANTLIVALVVIIHYEFLHRLTARMRSVRLHTVYVSCLAWWVRCWHILRKSGFLVAPTIL